MQKSDLPFGSEFSPSQIDLKQVLELARQYGGDWKAFEIAVRDKYFARNQTNDYNKRKLANNTKLAMIAYGLIDREARLTAFGENLYNVRNDSEVAYTELAGHILKNLHGTTLVQCVLDMQAGAEVVDLEKLRAWLDERGIHFPRGGKHPSIMRLWLEMAGVFVKGWRVDEARFREVLGASTDEVEALAGLTAEQRAYLKTLANMPGPGPYPSNDIEKLATATYGLKFSEKNLPKTVLYPLEQAGFVTLARGTKTVGRGAKPFLVTGTSKLQVEIIGPLLAQLEQQTDSDIRPMLRKPLEDVLADIESDDKHTRGLALEALAFKLMRLIDLVYVATRLRGTATGGAEVDVIFESSRLVFSRWQIQCRNCAWVTVDDVAKEIGLSYWLGGKAIVIVNLGSIDNRARDYASLVRASRGLQLIFLDGEALRRLSNRPSEIVRLINSQAPLALCTRSSQHGRVA